MTEGTGGVALLGVAGGAGSTLGGAVALEMARHGVRVALHDDTADTAGGLPEIRDAVMAAGGEVEIVNSAGLNGSRALAQEAIDRFARLDYLMNLYLPAPETDTAEQVAAYPATLLERCRTVGAAIADFARGGAVINHAPLPSIYTRARPQDSIPPPPGGITRGTPDA